MKTGEHRDGLTADSVREYSFLEIIRRLMSYFMPYRLMVVLALVTSLVSSALFVIQPYLIKIVLDSYIIPGDLEGLWTFILVITGVYFVGIVAEYFMNLITGVLGQKVMHDLRMDIYRHIMSMEMSFFDRNRVGRLMTRTTDDVASLNELYTSGAVSFINNAGVLAGIVVVMFTLDVKLSCAVLTVTPLIYITARTFAEKIRIIYRDIRKSTARLNAFLQENIQGIRLIKQMMRSVWSLAKFTGYSEDLNRNKIQNVFYYGVFFPLMEFIGVVAVVIILVYGGGRIHEGTLKLGVMVAFLRLTDMFFWPVREMAENFNIMMSAMASSERIFTLLDNEPSVTSPQSPVTTIDNTEIVFEHVWFAYEGEDWVLRDVSFKVQSGQRIAIVGPTGAGKTSIVNLLLRFYDIDRGRIIVGGRDIREMSLETLRGLFGHVGQDPFLFNRTVYENITLDGNEADHGFINDIMKRIGAGQFVQSLENGLDTPVMERGSRLSLGQKQLVSFARAMAANRKILILDEATAHIDTLTESMIQKAIPLLMENRTSIVIAHRLSTIRNVDTILVMARGRIRESGTHEELMKLNGIYATLSRMHLKA